VLQFLQSLELCIFAKHSVAAQSRLSFSLHYALAAAQCIVIGPVCGFVCVGVYVCSFVGMIPR